MQKTREGHIDLLRIIAAFAIIVIHTFSSHIDSKIGIATDNVKLMQELVCILMRWAVPVFFMITGYCLLKKKELTYKYCFKQISKFSIILATFGLVFALLEHIFVQGFTTSIFYMPILNLINGNIWDHMWYCYAIIGVYLVMPVIHSFMKKNVKGACILTCILFVLTVLIPFINSFGLFSIDFMLPFGGYLFYVCFGALVAICPFKKWIKITLCSLGLPAILCIIFIRDIQYDYLSIPVCIMAMAIFILANIKPINSNKVILLFAKTTWGIYIIHPIFINLIVKVLKPDLVSNLSFLKLSLMTVVYFSLSFAAVWVMKKIPILKKYI